MRLKATAQIVRNYQELVVNRRAYTASGSTEKPTCAENKEILRRGEGLHCKAFMANQKSSDLRTGIVIDDEDDR